MTEAPLSRHQERVLRVPGDLLTRATPERRDHLRHQRFRRDVPGALGMGPQAPGREHRGGQPRQRPPAEGRPRSRQVGGARLRRERRGARLHEGARLLVLVPGLGGAHHAHRGRGPQEAPGGGAPQGGAAGRGREFTRLGHIVDGRPRIKDAPPLIYHPDEADDPEFREVVTANFALYRESLPPERRILYDATSQAPLLPYAMPGGTMSGPAASGATIGRTLEAAS